MMAASSNNSMQLEGKTILLGITGGIVFPSSCIELLDDAAII